MAERKIFSRYNMRCGLVMKSKVAGVRLKGFKIPSFDQRFLVITSEDISDNSISLFGSTMPILADSEITYIGQPLLAVFGPEFESVELLMRQIEVETEPYDENDKEKLLRDETPPLFFSWGQDEAITSEEENKYKVIDSEFRIEPTVFISSLRYTVTLWKENESLYAELPTQWPELVVNTISKITGMAPKSINLRQSNLFSKRDEYLFMPAVYASLAAIATIRLALPVEIRAVGESARAGMTFIRHTILNDDGKPISESVDVTADQGAYQFAAKEMQRQIMTGLLPTYSLKSFMAKISIVSSNTHPASFAGSLGYSEALAATEYHHTKLLDKNCCTPVMFEAGEKGKTRFTDYAPSMELENITSLITPIAKASVFDRKWASNNFQHGDFSLVGYIKGIGLASGSSVAGFSTAMAKESGFSSIMTYTQKKNISVNAYVNNNDYLVKYWKSLISSRVEDEGSADNVVFLEQAPNAIDCGPDVLSRYASCFTPQLAAAAKRLNILRLADKIPVSIKFDAENTYYPCEFEHSGFGAVIAEVKISSMSFSPVVTEVWANFCLSHIIDQKDAYNKARCFILTTLGECGATIPSSFKLHLSLSSKEGISETITNIEALARALTMGAFANALYQAAGAKAAIMPTSAERIEQALAGGAK